MSASRFNRKARERLLYIATGLVMLVILAITIRVIPHVLHEMIPEARPEKTALVFSLLTAIHLIIMALLIRKIRVSRLGGRLRKIALIIPGIILVLMSMFLIDTAGTYLENQSDMHSVAIILFISACFDLMTGIIMIMLPTRIPDN